MENPTEINTNIQNTKKTNDMIDMIRAEVRENIDYDLLLYTREREPLNELVELIVETLCTSKDSIRIAKDEYPADYVRERLRKLDSEHICYAMDCIKKSDKKIGNIKAYMLTTLFNAPVTIDSYYTTSVHHDMQT